MILEIFIFMANIKSSIKDIKSSRKNATINKSNKSATKTAIKKAKVTKEKIDIAAAFKKIDQNLAKGIYKANKAAREKSKLSKLVNQNKQ